MLLSCSELCSCPSACATDCPGGLEYSTTTFWTSEAWGWTPSTTEMYADRLDRTTSYAARKRYLHATFAPPPPLHTTAALAAPVDRRWAGHGPSHSDVNSPKRPSTSKLRASHRARGLPPHRPCVNLNMWTECRWQIYQDRIDHGAVKRPDVPKHMHILADRHKRGPRWCRMDAHGEQPNCCVRSGTSNEAWPAK